MELIVNVTLRFPLRIPLFATLHIPLLFVTQEAEPVAPLLQAPLTVALATGEWLLA
jgi:hypothetical protein